MKRGGMFTVPPMVVLHFPNGSVERVDAEGVAVPFTCPEGIEKGYIDNNGELVGKPGQPPWSNENHPAIKGVAVDSGSGGAGTVPGEVYVLNTTEIGEGEVDEFSSAGCFVRAFSGVGVPLRPLGSSSLYGVAVDPTDGDVVVETEERRESSTVDVVDEFSSSGVYLGQVSGPSKGVFFGANSLNGDGHGGGVAVGSGGLLYVAVCEKEKVLGVCEEGGSVVDVFGGGAFFAGAATGGVVSNSSSLGSVVLGGVVRGVSREVEEGGLLSRKDLEVSKCGFEYLSEEVYVREGGFVGAAVVPCLLGSGGSVEGERLEEKNYGVHGDVVGLEAGRVYVYRLVVETNKSEHGGVEDGAVASFAAAAAPVVESESVGGVSSSFAEFGGRVDPRGADTSYEFEYVDVAGYEAAEAGGAVDPFAGGGVVPVPEGDVGGGDRGVSVSVPVGGLLAGTVYEYRLVASNSVGVADGAGGVFATVPAGPQGLPDGRAYELLTPVNKGDAEEMFGSPPGPEAKIKDEAFQNYDLGYASEEGNQFLLMVTSVAFGSFPGAGANSYVFSRGEKGWSFSAVASPRLGVQSSAVELFDPYDFSVVGVSDDIGSQEERELGLVGPAGGLLCEGGVLSGCYETAVSGEKDEAGLAGASKDLSSVVIESGERRLPLCESAQESLVGELVGDSRGLYEWSAARGCLSLVDVKSGSEGGGLVSTCGAVLGLGPEGDNTASGSTHDAVSADGSGIFFTAPDPKASGSSSQCWEEGRGKVPPQLYVRLHGETTLEVSASEPGGEPVPGYPALYVGASENGSKVFFLTRSELTKEAVELGGHEPELYECEVVEEAGGARCALTRIASRYPELVGKIADVPAVSADGSMVYLNAEGGPGDPDGGLYGYDTVSGALTRIAADQGYVDGNHKGAGDPWYDPGPRDEAKNGLLAGLDVQAPYDTTRDGQFLLFGAYRYDADLPVSGSNPVCVMCDPDGSGPIGEPEASFTRSAVHANNDAGGPPHAMSENGKYVFFDSTLSLVPQDTNGTLDVYEWEEDGTGSCTESKGCIGLISSGEDPSPSFFLDAGSYVNPATGQTVEGGNVFFGSHANLIPSLDTASEGNLYDARIEGGFPVPTSVGTCEGDACSNPPLAPTEQTPGSSTFSGAGNVATHEKEEKAKGKKGGKSKPKARGKGKTRAGKRGKPKACRRGLVSRKGRCVRQMGKAEKSGAGEGRGE